MGARGREEFVGRGAIEDVGVNFGPEERAHPPPGFGDDEIALKVPRAGTLVTPDLRERFFREATSAAGLDHPHIVPVYEAGAIGPIYYIASGYVPGTTLAEELNRRSIEIPLASELTRYDHILCR